MNNATNFTRYFSRVGLKDRKMREKDVVYIRVQNLLTETLMKEESIDEIIPLEQSLHAKLLPVEFDNPNHHIMEELLKFNSGGLDIIKELKIETEAHVRIWQSITTSLEECYKHIYLKDPEIN